jgi:hypothetical protein
MLPCGRIDLLWGSPGTVDPRTQDGLNGLIELARSVRRLSFPPPTLGTRRWPNSGIRRRHEHEAFDNLGTIYGDIKRD